MTLQINSEREERVQREYEKWETKYHIPFEQEFTVKTLLRLRDQFNSVDEDHTKKKMELLHMIKKVEDGLRLKPKESSTNIENRKILFVSIQEAKLNDMFSLVKHLLVNDPDRVHISMHAHKKVIEVPNTAIEFRKKDYDLIGVRFDLCIDLDAAYDKRNYAGFREMIEKSKKN